MRENCVLSEIWLNFSLKERLSQQKQWKNNAVYGINLYSYSISKGLRTFYGLFRHRSHNWVSVLTRNTARFNMGPYSWDTTVESSILSLTHKCYHVSTDFSFYTFPLDHSLFSCTPFDLSVEHSFVVAILFLSSYLFLTFSLDLSNPGWSGENYSDF